MLRTLVASAVRPRRWSSLPAVLLLAGLAACGGGGDSPGPTPPPTAGTLAVGLSNFPASVVAGGQATVGVTITRGGSFTGAVTLAAEGAPSGVTASWSTTSLAAGATTATLTLQVGSAVAAGTYPITVRATGAGVTAATAQYALLVTAAPVPSFALAAAPGAVTVVAGQQGTSTVSITRDGGFTGAVQLAAEGAPTGVTTSFSANPVTGASATLTLAVGASTVAGTYPITVRGTGTGVTERTATVTLTVTTQTPTPSLTIASAVGTATVAQGQSSAGIALTITRGGGLTGNATLALEGAPAGVTGTFTPNPATATTSQLVLNVGATTAAGTYPLTVRGTVGTTSGTAAISLTVTAAAPGDFSLAMAPTAATLTAGTSTSPVVAITRTGGFTGTVNLTASGAPAGVTVSFSPAAATGAQATMTVSTNVGTAAGTYTITVRGNASGIAERTTTFALTVQGAGGGGGNVVWQFCDTDRFPLWFAYRDGTTGAWTRVLPGANQTYAFTINSALGGVTYVIQDGGTDFDVTTFYATRAELTAFGQSECDNNPGRKTLTGTVAGLAAGQSASIAVGGGSGSASVNGPFSVTNVQDGPTDLLAARTSTNLMTFSTEPDRFILRRNLNLPNNGVIPALDFGGAESFAPATATYTIGNLAGANLFVTTGFTTANGSAGFFSFGPLVGGTETRTIYGVPTARTQTGDLHYVLASAVTGTDNIRLVAGYNRELANRTLTLGSALNAPTVSTVASAPYRRARASGTWQAEYNQGAGVAFTQSGGTGRSWTLTTTFGYSGGATYELEVPDLSAVAGFNTLWGLQPAVSTDWSLSASRVDNAAPNAPTENFRFFSASRSGNLP
jgi:uncharacterized membrane protein